MRILKIVSILFLTGIFHTGLSQQPDLKEMLDNENLAGNDTSHVNLLISICDSLYRTKPSEAITYGTEALELSRLLEFKNGEALALKYIGMGYYIQGEYAKTIDYFTRSKDVFLETGNKKGVANMLNNIGVIYNNFGDDARALDLYLQSLKISEEIRDSRRELTALVNIGLIYSKKQKTRDQAYEYYIRALKISQELAYLDGIATVTVNLGELFYNKGDYDKSLEYYVEALGVYQKTNSGNIPYTLLSMGKAFSKKGDYENAVKYLLNALDMSRKNKSRLEEGQTLLELGKTYLQKGDFSQALQYYRKSENIAKDLGANYELKEIYDGTAKLYSEIADFSNAYRYQVLESRLKDTLYANTSPSKLDSIVFQYKLDAFSKENEILKRDVSLQEAKGKQQVIVIFFLVLGFFSICIFLVFIARANNHKRKANEALNKANSELSVALETVNNQKKEIEEAHEEITASIRYAKYIQSSVLPKPEQMSCNLGEHFIIYNPKEIVSGDFYWVSHSGNKTIIAVADCTGHGVPGAFMSMLGMTLLNEIVTKESITTPGLVLDRLRKEITKSLKQKGERLEQKDGMDITICTIDRNTMKLQFAGANNPMYIIRKTGLETSGIVHDESANGVTLLEIKGDHMPIGIVDDMENFTTHEINIYDSDSFYMFSDGFPDQFGGAGHKKFSYKRLRECLVSTNHGSMADQKTGMEEIMKNWIGSGSQTDDMLMVGFRIN
jgi:serine phosphatase RsbU (regulator of sigma subunit)